MTANGFSRAADAGETVAGPDTVDAFAAVDAAGASPENAATPDTPAPVDPAALPELLALVLRQARALGIPVSGNIAPAVRLNTRAKKRFGCCIGSRKSGFVIELSAALPAAGRAVCLQTLAHEVLHTCPGCQNHGPQWKTYAARMNAACGYHIHRLDKPEALGVQLPPAAPPHYRWRVTCQRCGRQFYRQKASPLIRRPSAYRCAGCGGRLRVEALDGQPLPRAARR